MSSSRERVEHRDAGLLAIEEVVVVELDRRRRPSGRAACVSDSAQALRRVEHGLAVPHRDHAAELALVAAAERRLMDRGARAHEAGAQVRPHVGQAVVGQQRQPFGPHRRALGVVHGPAVALPGEAGDVLDRRRIARRIVRRGRPGVGQVLEQIDQRRLALPAHHVVDVGRVDRRVGIERREVAAPDDRHRRVRGADCNRKG